MWEKKHVLDTLGLDSSAVSGLYLRKECPGAREMTVSKVNATEHEDLSSDPSSYRKAKCASKLQQHQRYGGWDAGRVELTG